jgi:hypothetical protein
VTIKTKKAADKNIFAPWGLESYFRAKINNPPTSGGQLWQLIILDVKKYANACIGLVFLHI